MNALKVMLVAAFAAIALSPTANASFTLSLVGAYNNSNPGSAPLQGLSSGTTATASASSGFGGGALLGFGHRVGFVTGALSLPRNANISGSFSGTSYTGTVTSTYLMIPALFRFHLGAGFSFQIGGYYGIGQGTTTLSMNSGGQSDSGPNSFNDYGAMAGLGYTLPLTGRMSFVLDAYYVKSLQTSKYPLSTVTGSGNTNTGLTMQASYTDLMALAGFKFLF